MSIRKSIIAILSIILLASCLFSPQNKTNYLVAFNPFPDIYLLDVNDGTVENITESFFPIEYCAWLCEFSHDGRYLLFTVDTSHVDNSGTFRYGDVYCYDVQTGDIEKLTQSACKNFDAKFSPNDKKIVFMSTYNHSYDTFIMDRDGSNCYDLCPTIQMEFWPSFSADEQYIYYLRLKGQEFNICRNTLDGLNEEILSDNNGQSNSYCVSEDGSMLYYDGVGIVAKDLNDGLISQLTPVNVFGSHYNKPKLSPGDSLLAYRHEYDFESHACIMNIDGNNKKEICEAYDFEFSKDGKYLFCQWNEGIARYDISTGILDTLFQDSINSIYMEVAIAR